MARNELKPEEVRETFKRYKLKLPQVKRIADCKRLCAGWHDLFGGCLVLDDDRLWALCRRLIDDKFTFLDCAWAIQAYYEYCQTDRWHVENPELRKTIASFFKDGKFDHWVQKGHDLAARRLGGRREASARAAVDGQADRLAAAWRAKSPAEQRALLERAAAELNMQARPQRERTITHPVVRSKVMQYVQAELKAAAIAATPVGELV